MSIIADQKAGLFRPAFFIESKMIPWHLAKWLQKIYTLRFNSKWVPK